jgi:ABC-type lipoprotein release transport system permease subunit
MISLLLHAGRSYLRNLHRYRVVILAFVVVVSVLVFVLGTAQGLQETIREKAARYFAGDVVVLGYDGSGDSLIEKPEAVLDAVEQAAERSGLDYRAVSRRSTHYKQLDISLFYAGYWTQQRRLVGVEWGRERPVLQSFDFASGGVPEAGDRDAVLVSTAVAEELKLRVGDRLIVSITSSRGRANTAELTVRGIYREASFFGYTTYMQRHALNRLKEVPEGRINEIGVYLERPRQNQGRAARAITEALGQTLPTFPVIEKREGYNEAAGANRDGREYGVVTLEAQLTEIQDLLGAVTIIATLIIVLFLGIVVVGVGNTYSMIVYERTREIGTLRALGMQRPRTIALFLLESLFLGATGVAAGMAAGVGALEAVRVWAEFPPSAWSTIFLVGGHLQWSLDAGTLGMVAGIAVGASLLGALRASLRAGLIRPVDALRHE